MNGIGLGEANAVTGVGGQMSAEAKRAQYEREACLRAEIYLRRVQNGWLIELRVPMAGRNDHWVAKSAAEVQTLVDQLVGDLEAGKTPVA